MHDQRHPFWSELGAELGKMLGRAADALAKLEDNLQFLEEGVQWFATEGWPISDTLAAPQVLSLIAIARTTSIPSAFVQLYDADDGHEIGRAFSQMRSSTRMAKLTTLLTELEHSLCDRRHTICVPAFITMMEGLAFSTPTQSTKVVKAIADHAARVSADPTSRFDAVIWKGIRTFVDEIFFNSDFTGQEPRLNRHWIMHGRATANWTREDAVRLLHAVRVLDESLDGLAAAASSPPRPQ